MVSRLFDPANRKSYLTDNDLVEASKGVHAALKGSLPPMVREAVGAILHKEMENRFNELVKRYEDRMADLRESYEQKLFDLQERHSKDLDDITTLVKTVSVPGVTEDVGMEIVSRTMKMLETKMEKRLDEVKVEIQGQLKTITESVMDDMDAMTKAFDDKQELLISFVKNFQVQNSFVVPENGIQTSVEVKQLPSVVNFTAPKGSIKTSVEVKQLPSVVNFNAPKDSIKIESKTILEESDKTSEKSIEYGPDGRPSIIREKIKRTQK